MIKKLLQKRQDPKSAVRSKPQKRVKKQQHYKPFRLQKAIKSIHAEPRPAFKSFIYSLRLIFGNKIEMLKYSAVALFCLLTVSRGLSEIDTLAQSRTESGEVPLSRFDELAQEALDVVEYTQATSGTGAFYRFVIFIILSMALIWTLRRIYDKESVSLRGAFYTGTAQFVPYMIVMLIVFLQSLPALFADFLTRAAVNGDLLVTTTETIAFYSLMTFLIGLTMVLYAGSVFGLIIATLPGSRPIQSLKDGFELTKFRRKQLILQLSGGLALVFALWLGLIVISLQISTLVAELTFYAASMFAFILIHAYVYVTYREYIK